MIEFLKKMLVLFVTLLVTLGLIELGLRRFMPVEYRPPASELPQVAGEIIYQVSSVPDLDYELAPDIETEAYGVTVSTNRYGMRGDEPDPKKSKRIVVLGDSFTFGFQIPGEKVFSSRLEQALQAQDGDYEVLNLAVPGYSIKDEVATLEHKGMPWAPEVIIVGYVMNDPEVEPIQQIPAYFREPSWWQHSHVLRLFARGNKRIHMLLKGGGDYYRYLHADRKRWAGVVAGFENIRDMADGNGARVIVLLFPDLWHAWENYPYGTIHQQVTDLALDKGFEVIDLLEYYSVYSPAELRISAGDGHPNELAHELAAQAILELLSP